MNSLLPDQTSCADCSFMLFNPISTLPSSHVGLYDDARFPGRSIVSLRVHEENMAEMNDGLLYLFMQDVQKTMKAIQDVTSCSRVNVAILGNTISHVHAHLIPRWPEKEQFPGKSPWNDPRPTEPLTAAAKADLIAAIRHKL